MSDYPPLSKLIKRPLGVPGVRERHNATLWLLKRRFPRLSVALITKIRLHAECVELSLQPEPSTQDLWNEFEPELRAGPSLDFFERMRSKRRELDFAAGEHLKVTQELVDLVSSQDARLEKLDNKTFFTEYHSQRLLDEEETIKIEREADNERFFSQPAAIADFPYWSGTTSFRRYELVALSLGKDPAHVKPSTLRPFRSSSPFTREFHRRLNILVRATEAGELSTHGATKKLVHINEFREWLTSSHAFAFPDLDRLKAAKQQPAKVRPNQDLIDAIVDTIRRTSGLHKVRPTKKHLRQVLWPLLHSAKIHKKELDQGIFPKLRDLLPSGRGAPEKVPAARFARYENELIAKVTLLLRGRAIKPK